MNAGRINSAHSDTEEIVEAFFIIWFYMPHTTYRLLLLVLDSAAISQTFLLQ